MTIKDLEILSMNAWPSLHTILYDGWILRFAQGVTKRSNSIYPLFKSIIGINEKISKCEEEYQCNQLPVIFKMTETVIPENLDEILNNYGYHKEELTSVKLLNLNKPFEINSQSFYNKHYLYRKWLTEFGKSTKLRPGN